MTNVTRPCCHIEENANVEAIGVSREDIGSPIAVEISDGLCHPLRKKHHRGERDITRCTEIPKYREIRAEVGNKVGFAI